MTDTTDRWGGDSNWKCKFSESSDQRCRTGLEEVCECGWGVNVWTVVLTLSLQPCPGMRCLLCPPLLGWLCSWRSLLISSCPTESRKRESKTLRHASHSSHCRHLSASTRPKNVSDGKKGGQTHTHKKKHQLILCEGIKRQWLKYFIHSMNKEICSTYETWNYQS